MRDTLLDVDGAYKVLGISRATFFRHFAKRIYPFLRTGFSEDYPKGRLYFSKIRLKDKSWSQEFCAEKELMKQQEREERKLALKIILTSIEADEMFIKLQKNLPDEEKSKLEVDLALKQTELAKMNMDIEKVQKQRIVDFFGKENAVIFFKDSLFKGEYKKLEESHRHDFYTAQPPDEEAIQARRMAEEAELRAARRRFAEQEAERAKKK